MAPRDEVRQLPVGTMFIDSQRYRCSVEGCGLTTNLRIWAGDRFAAACADHEREVATRVLGARTTRAAG